MSALGYMHVISFTTPTGVVDVEVRELTVAQIRQMMAAEAATPAEPVTLLDAMLWGHDVSGGAIDISPRDIPTFTDLTLEKSESLTMRQRQAVMDKIREVNDGFFGVMGALLAAALPPETVKQKPEPISESLSAASPP